MKYRVLPLVLAVVALALFAGAPALAQDKEKAIDGDTHEGIIVKVEDNKLTMKGKDGTGEHSHTLNKDVRFSLDNKAAKMEDLKPGQRVRVTTKKGDKNTILRIEALDKEKDFPKP